MSNLTKITLFAAIILSTAFSALTAANAGATRMRAASSGTGMAGYVRDGGTVPIPGYDRDGGIVPVPNLNHTPSQVVE